MIRITIPIRSLLAPLVRKLNEARLLWPDSVALGVFLTFAMGLAMLLAPFSPHTADQSAIVQAYPGEIALLGAMFLAATLWAIISPLYGGLGATLLYGAFSLLSVTHPFNPVFFPLWVIWMSLAVHGSYVRIAELRHVQRRWDDILRFHADNTQMVPFYLLRLQDVSGVSGTGIVAEGCLFSDGRVALTWTTETAIHTMTSFASLDDVRTIHGHNGQTIIAWADPRLIPKEPPVSSPV